VLKIRLQRTGRRKRPYYRIVVAEHSAPIQGRYVALVGNYDPIVDKHGLTFDADLIKSWIQKGAQPTNTVARLLKGAGVAEMDAFVKDMKDRATKNPKEVPEAPAAPAVEASKEEKTEEAPKEETVEAPATEAPAEVKTEEAPATETPAAEDKEPVESAEA